MQNDPPRNDKQVVEAWIELQRTPRDSDRHKELFWSFDRLDDLVRTQPGKAWQLIIDILRTDASDHILQNLSAGPLEDLLVRHGSSIIEDVEAEAARNPMFRRLLAGVWKRDMVDDVWNRIARWADRKGWDGTVL
jgi:hypothetical protein